MKLLWIGGNHQRHLHVLNQLHEAVGVSAIVIEERENMVPQPPSGLCERDRKNFIRHFESRLQAERRYFGACEIPEVPRLDTSSGRLNSRETAQFVSSASPDAAIVFGCGMIRPPLLEALPKHTLNIHLGLAPWYRGAATLFWPFYFLEPTFAGSTFHYLAAEADAGDIVHQAVPALEPEDGIHDVACKTVLVSADAAGRLMEHLLSKGAWASKRQRPSGRTFLSRDFKAEHLRVIYDLFDDGMVREYCEGRLHAATPALIRQF